MIVNVLTTSTEDKGKYKMMEVVYKSADGKAATKKLMSFTFPDVFKFFTSVKAGDAVNVTTVKNDKGFWDWTAASNSSGEESVSKPAAGNATPRSTYETADERAARQVLIVRQSTLSNALEYYKLAGKKAPSIQEIMEVANTFENHVFGRKDKPKDIDITELEDDIPL